MMNRWIIGLTLVLSLILLVGCGGGDTASAAADSAPAISDNATGNNRNNGGPGGFGGYESESLSNDYDGALPITMQLPMGILQLEGTSDAVTADQAQKLVTLWQAIQGGTIQNATERNAIYKQIEGALTAQQLTAISDMQLTFEDMNAWAAANGIELPQGNFGQRRQGGDGGPLANLSEEERAKFREEMQNLSQEERQARLAELGIEFGQGGRGGGGQDDGRQGGRGGGRIGALLQPLIELLQTRSAG